MLVGVSEVSPHQDRGFWDASQSCCRAVLSCILVYLMCEREWIIIRKQGVVSVSVSVCMYVCV